MAPAAAVSRNRSRAGRSSGLSRVAIVDEAEFRGNRQAITEDPPVQEVELTGDGVVFDLLVAGDPGIQAGSKARW